ncbi:hypothetical protein HII31_05846 [Pseudocercospora fuligena]|uniref:Uncharacterized protein n=1 Tax=Pseudocercospora fuligena TaxID=685502 RepID=A0A8H6RKG9_9PEZI|nr:hypothetical protein HII31_05846 [Pseudocercospora fuligena]
MASAPTPGNQVSGIDANTWYSIQSFSSDYYLGLSNGSQPEVELLSGDDENSTLWQFIPAGPDTSRGVYALRSATSSGLYCLFASGDGPTAVPCGTNSGQVQAFYASTDGGADNGVVLVPYPNSASRAFSADGGSSEGDDVDLDELNDFQDEDVDLLWAIQSQGVVDTVAYPPISATYTGDSTAPTTATSATASASSSQVVVTAADGSTVPIPTGTPSPRPSEPTETSETNTSPSSTTLTVTTELPASTTEASTPAESSESASASPSVEVQQGNDATTSVPARHVWLGVALLALFGAGL